MRYASNERSDVIDKELTLGSLCDGSGGFPLGGQLAGIRPVWAAEIEPFPVRVTHKHFPDMQHLGNIEKINGAEIEPVDIICGGTPCFPADTLVLTEYGLVPIQDVAIGDRVLTHKGRWREVLCIGRKKAKTLILKGNHYGLECTANHPIYSMTTRNSYSQKDGSDGKTPVRVINKIEWTPAQDMKRKMWGVPNSFEVLPIPEIGSDNRHRPILLSSELFYFIGRWLGDGWIDGHGYCLDSDGSWVKRRSSRILISDSTDKEMELLETILPVHPSPTLHRFDTVSRFEFSHLYLAKWLVDNFGSGSYGKKIPSWALGMPGVWRRALLQGIIDSDGYKASEHRVVISTVSKRLALGIRMLGDTLGFRTRLGFSGKEYFHMLRGKEVKSPAVYITSLSISSPESKHRSSLISNSTTTFYPVKQIEEVNNPKVVYNIEVDEDHSYVANGIVVHNCQNFSIAGNRQGLAGQKSRLFYDFIRIIREMRSSTNNQYPSCVVFENVLGLLSSSGGKDFEEVLNQFCSLAGEGGLHVPRPKRWQKAGAILGDTFSLGWRTFNAQYWGVPQSRRRIYLVECFGNESGGGVIATQLLQEYSLTPRACQGILRRARDKGRKLHPILECMLTEYAEGRGPYVDISNLLVDEECIHDGCISVENYPTDGRLKIRADGSVQSLVAGIGTGGGRVPVTIHDAGGGNK